jgi:hypothetical protein
MKIDEYRFGHITINGKKYTSDVKIFPDEVKPNWRRISGHSLDISDIDDILSKKPELLIIGTGSAGVLKVPDEIKNSILEKGITLIIEKTKEACNIYNELSGKKYIVAALHLTC